MNGRDDRLLLSTRRHFLGQAAGLSLGAIALDSLEAGDALPSSSRPFPHFAPKARRVIFLTQSGAPSQIELFDYKPELVKWEGIEVPESVRRGLRVTTMTSNQKQLLMGGKTRFFRCGPSVRVAGVRWIV